MKTIEIVKPDDWHLHLRDDPYLNDTITGSIKHFQRALIMPNLLPPLATVDLINDYKARIDKQIDNSFKPYFTLYLTDTTTPETLIKAANTDYILGTKLYPKGATTHSDAGVNSLTALYPLFDIMQEQNLVLQIHGETTHDDIFHREKSFINNDLVPLAKAFPKLRIVLEHISTKAASDFVTEASDNVAATITIHHLLYNRNDMLSGGIKPHLYCLPILKKESDQKAVQLAALSGNPSFFLGTDSAPHAINDKESACGCAGIYSAPFALPLYASFFEENQSLDNLEAFSAYHGADFYQLPRNQEKITLIQSPQTIPDTLSFGDKVIKPIQAGQTIDWCIKDE